MKNKRNHLLVTHGHLFAQNPPHIVLAALCDHGGIAIGGVVETSAIGTVGDLLFMGSEHAINRQIFNGAA
ncbi:MAG: hypothetical protein ABJN11_14585 [Lentilitoribacter sp.]